MKRKVLSALLSVAMVATLLVGCGSSAETTGAPAEEAAPAEDAAEEAAPAEEAAEGEEEAAAPAGEGGLI